MSGVMFLAVICGHNSRAMFSTMICVVIAILHLLHSATGQPLSLSDCTDGFIDQDLSTALQSGSLTVPYDQQRIIPGISFNCSGAITAWTIGAEWRTGGSHDFFPHLQIWRSTSCATNTFVLVGDVELFVAGERQRGNYVFSGTPDPPLEFEAGDILGIFQPRESRSRVRVYYDTSAGPTNYYIDTDNAEQPSMAGFTTTSADDTENSLPLVTIEIGPSTSTDYDLFDEADLTTALETSTSLTIPYEQQRILPDIPLNCSGSITSWTVGAEWRTGGNHNFFPHLQIWRSVVEGCSYDLIGDTELFVLGGTERRRDNYTFSGTPDPAIEFQKGDILGIYQPRESRARVRVYYDTSTGPSNYYNDIGDADVPPMVPDQDDFGIVTANGIENGLPLLAIQIAIDCDPLEDPENGTVVITAIAPDSLTATYSCLTGFDLVGEEVRSCDCQNTGGMWTGMAPTCMLIDCGGLTAPERGQIMLTPGVVVTADSGLNAVANYSCDEGYNVDGDQTRTCQRSGEWTGAAPTCTLIDCGDLTDPEGGQVTFTPGVVTTTNTGLDAVATYTCNSSAGYMLFDTGFSPTRTCQDSGLWSGVAALCTRCDFGTLTDPENGRFGITIPGGEITASYTCNMGYQLVGNESLTCQSTGQFSAQEPLCVVIDCGNLTAPEDGQVTFTSGVVTTIETGLDAVANYTCSEGYNLLGDEMRTCQVDGQWAGAEPTCMLINCTILTAPENGRVTFTPGVVATIETGLDAVANYTCNEGYDLVGDTLRTCEANGQWDGGEPTCMAIDCGNLTAPEGGRVTFTPGMVNTLETGLDAVATYTCNEGYDLVGDTLRTCEANGQWDGGEPTCRVIDCGNLTAPEGGQVTFTPGVVMTLETGLDAVATYTCSVGYNLVGEALRTCQADEQWTPTEPSCTPIDCGNLTAPEGGQVTFTPGVVMTIETGLDAVANYTCNEGYNLVGEALRTCQADEQWDGTVPNCMPIDCGNLADPEGGQVTFTSGLDAIANYTCNEGYNLVGDAVRTCQANEEWTGAAPTCTLIDCGGLANPEGGQIMLTPGVVMTVDTGLNAVATYSCDEGYNVDGDQTRTCQRSGEWTGAAPTCTLIDCGGLGDPVNGQVIISPSLVTTTGVGAVATYTCNTSAGFMLVGTVMRTCQDSGQWSGMVPECIRCNTDSITDPRNGSVAITSPGGVIIASYTCDVGYELVGVASRTCQSDGQFSGQQPVCQVIDCGEPPSVDDGGFNVTETTFESLAQYGCNEGFTLSGSQSRTCQADGTWSGTDPVCVAPARQSSSSPAIAAGVVVGLVVAALIALGIIVVIILRRRRQRKGGANIVTGSSGNRLEDLSNPIYSGEIDGRYVGIAGTGSASYVKSNDCDKVANSNIYEMAEIVQPAGTLTSTTSDYDDIVDPHRSSTLVIANPSPMESQHYELPARRNIYSTMSDSSMIPVTHYEEPVGSSMNPYEWDIHVPTKEQREVLTMSGESSAMNSEAHGTDENVYAALIEVQRATTVSTRSTTSMMFFEESDTYWAPSSNPSELYEQLAVKKYREIPRNHIQIVEHLGAGQFGTVNKGTWQTAEKTLEIAVKMLKAGARENDKVKFLQEAAINGQFRHPNVVKLLGVVTVGNPVMIVLEYLSNGDLRDYLNNQRPVPGELPSSQMPSLLLGFCQQVARGMEHLSQKAFIHRDLAARNVLVSENKICKISDFGMSRDLADENYYVSHGGKVPVKWTAPEAIHFKKYTTSSDVWSYGAVMYEIWSLGHKPFKGYTNQEAINLVDDGYRLPPPPGCPKKLYSLMIQCWNPEKFSRPTFPQIVSALSESELELLCWTERDTEAHPQAMLLGAPLEAGGNLYPELQGAYK